MDVLPHVLQRSGACFVLYVALGLLRYVVSADLPTATSRLWIDTDSFMRQLRSQEHTRYES